MPTKQELKTMPVRQYLDSTVVPIILQAFTQLGKQRPEDPINYLAEYLLSHKDDKKKE